MVKGNRYGLRNRNEIAGIKHEVGTSNKHFWKLVILQDRWKRDLSPEILPQEISIQEQYSFQELTVNHPDARVR